ncbi:MAG: hypothetical protein LBD84_01010 [Campylobacteraceae bacterium]|jgi:hypothetical protein|nr:hypothetical protein [Campylobacteraceae bacterium]
MHSKKIFGILVALFALMISVGFGLDRFGNFETDLKYVNEKKHFPEFKEQADEIQHLITRLYNSKDDYKYDEKNFKNKYQNKLKSFFIGFKVDNPNPQIQAIKEISLTPHDDVYATFYIVASGDTLERNDELFQKVFGYKKGIVSNLIVVKNFSRNITDKLKEYSELLKTKGFEKSEIIPNTWVKKNNSGKVTHTWNFYNAAGKSTASWTAGN